MLNLRCSLVGFHFLEILSQLVVLGLFCSTLDWKHVQLTIVLSDGDSQVWWTS